MSRGQYFQMLPEQHSVNVTKTVVDAEKLNAHFSESSLAAWSLGGDNMSFSFSQALISETCPLTQPMGSDGRSQVTLQLAHHVSSVKFNSKSRFYSVSRSTREKASCHRSSSAKTCASTQPTRSTADLPVRSSADLALPDNVLFLDGQRQRSSKSP